MLAIDTETTGHDLHHGCKPFFVSAYYGTDDILFWEWDVDPLTREPQPKPEDLAELRDILRNPLGYRPNRRPDFDRLLFHNTKFDVRALSTFDLIEELADDLSWWDKVDDSLILSHVLGSAESHKLKDISLWQFGISDEDQRELQEATNAARRIGRKLGWRIADKGDPHFPAQLRAPKTKGEGEGWWVMDTWLPRAVCRYATTRPIRERIGPYSAGQLTDPEHPWWTVLQRYGVQDAERTWHTFRRAYAEVIKRDQVPHYDQRRRLLPTVYRIETFGITANAKAIDSETARHEHLQKTAEARCKSISGDKLRSLRSPKQLKTILYSDLGLPVLKQTKTGEPSTDKETITALINEHCEPGSEQLAFCENLLLARCHSKAQEYLQGYRLFGKPVEQPSVTLSDSHVGRLVDALNARKPALRPLRKVGQAATFPHEKAPKGRLKPLRKAGTDGSCLTPDRVMHRWYDWLTLHPNFNITGTRTTRFSSHYPNAQNISKQERINLRAVFGPRPGRIWYALDYSNIEMRIFAYQCGDQSLIDCFESGKKVHLVVCEVLYPDLYAACVRDGVSFNERYEDTLYQWVKNGNFSLIYGAGWRRADSTYRYKGAYDLIRNRLPLIDQFMREKEREGRETGQVLTLCGYPLQVASSEPHVAVNYFVQGSAGWCIVLAMNRIDDYLRDLEAIYGDTHGGYRMVMTIHDELVFDFPDLPHVETEIVPHIKGIMELSGRDIGVPTPAEVKRITDTWATGKKLAI